MRGIHLLHPYVRAKAERLEALCAAHGLDMKITDTLRTAEEQDRLFAQGRTAPGSIVTNARGTDYRSPHQWGVAFDFCKNIRGQEYGDRAFFSQVGVLGKSLGLFWGGDFKGFADMPHFEEPIYVADNSTNTLRSKYKTPERFFEAWTVSESIERTVANLISDGVAEDAAHWRGFLHGITNTRKEYVKTIFDRYHALLQERRNQG